MRILKLTLFIIFPLFLLAAEPFTIDAFLLIDQSGSMKDTDPHNIRISAAEYFIDLLSQDYSKTLKHRLGIVNFGDKPPQTIPLTYLSPEGAAKLKNSLKPLDLGNTSFISALKEAKREFQRGERESQKVVIILTDGEPDDSRKLSLGDYFKEIEDFVRSQMQDVVIYTILVDTKDRFWKKDKPYWDKITGNKTHLLRSMDEKQLQNLYTEIGASLMRGLAPEWRSLPSEGREVSVNVDPYLENIKFIVRKTDKKTKVEIIRPNGKPISSKDKDVTHTGPIKGWNIYSEIFTVLEPQPGEWKYKLSGEGEVEVGKTPIPVEMKLLSPKGKLLSTTISSQGEKEEIYLYPVGKPIVVIASFLKRDGSPVKEIPGYRLYLGAKVTTPDGVTRPLDLREREEGVYYSSQIVETKREGDYQLVPVVKGGNQDISPKTIYVLRAKPIPYLKLEEPKPGATYPPGKKFKIRASILVSSKPISPESFFTDSPNSLLWAQLKRGNKLLPVSIDFTYKREDKSFEGIAVAPKKQGIYTVSIQLSGHLLSGEKYVAEPPEEISLRIKHSPISLLSFYWWVILPILILGLVIWRIIIYLQRPLYGRIEWIYIPTQGGAQLKGSEILRGKIMKLGGGSKDDIKPNVSGWPATTWCIFRAKSKGGSDIVYAKYVSSGLGTKTQTWLERELKNGDYFSLRFKGEEITITYYEV
jgi:uncharacterized protein YegL